MPTQIIKWKPSASPNVIAYVILFSDTGITGAYTTLTQVLHQIPGTNYEDTGGFFFYEDLEVPYRYYRIQVLDQFGNTATDTAPTPFQAGNDPAEVPTLYTLALDHDTGTANALQYVTAGGTPIEEATVRIYRKIDWDAQNLATVVGSTVTTAAGSWTSPVFVQPGETYTVVFQKPYAYGPDTVEITV